MLRGSGKVLNGETKNEKELTKRNILDSYLAEFMWQSKLNGRYPFEEILEYIYEF